MSAEISARYQPLDSESKLEWLKRYKRLRKEHRSRESSMMLASGLLPENIRKWPPRLRYMLAERMNKANLLCGTEAWEKNQAEEIINIRVWLDGWFQRNHQKETDGTQ